MTAKGPFDLVRHMAEIFDDLGVKYALGGSLASSLLGEPRSTVDVDMAVALDVAAGEALLELLGATFYIPIEAARAAIREHSSFNVIETAHALKVDLFVLGDGLLDRNQIERRVLIPIPGAPNGIWISSAEDQVLRKLDWFRQGGSVSDRQWRDEVGILRIHAEAMDLDYLMATATEVGLAVNVLEALRESGYESTQVLAHGFERDFQDRDGQTNWAVAYPKGS